MKHCNSLVPQRWIDQGFWGGGLELSQVRALWWWIISFLASNCFIGLYSAPPISSPQTVKLVYSVILLLPISAVMKSDASSLSPRGPVSVWRVEFASCHCVRVLLDPIPLLHGFKLPLLDLGYLIPVFTVYSVYTKLTMHLQLEHFNRAMQVLKLVTVILLCTCKWSAH